MCCESPTPPAAPDTSKYQQGMVDAANADLAFRQQVYNESKPRQQQLYNLAMQAAQQQLGDASTARERSAQAWGDWNRLGRPLQEQVIGEARDYGGAADQAMQSGRAVADVNAQVANQRGQASRMAAAMGKKYMNAPGDDVRAAGLAAGAATGARTAARDKGIALRAGALGQLTGQQNVAAQNLGLGVNAGSAGLGSANTGFMSGLPYAQYASGGYGGLMQAYQGAGGMGLQNYQVQAGMYNADQNAPSTMGALLGMGGTILGGPLGGVVGNWAGSKFG